MVRRGEDLQLPYIPARFYVRRTPILKGDLQVIEEWGRGFILRSTQAKPDALQISPSLSGSKITIAPSVLIHNIFHAIAYLKASSLAAHGPAEASGGGQKFHFREGFFFTGLSTVL